MRRDLPLELCDAIDDALDIDPARRPAPARLRAGLRAAEGELADEGGLVEPATLRRVGLPTTSGRRSLFGRRPGWDEALAPAAAGRSGESAPLPAATVVSPGLAAGGLVLACILGLGPDPSFSPLVAAASRRPPPRCCRASAGCWR